MDLNQDGRLDILSGSYSRNSQPMAGLFQVLWGTDDGAFQAARELTGTDGEPLIIPEGDDVEQNGGVSLENICTRPFAVDWDSDGDLDLIVGNFGGTFYVFWGKGEGQFEPVADPIKSAGERLKLKGRHSDPFVVDWDGDGDLDIVSGSDQGGVQWSENVAAEGEAPELTAFQTLIAASENITFGSYIKEEELLGPAMATRVWVDDVNNDGKLDVLVGDMVQLTSPAPGLSEEECRAMYDAWMKEIQQASEEYSAAMTDAQNQEDAAEDKEDVGEQSTLGRIWGSLFGGENQNENQTRLERAQERYSEVYQKQSEFMTSEMTGYVWLYLQE